MRSRVVTFTVAIGLLLCSKLNGDVSIFARSLAATEAQRDLVNLRQFQAAADRFVAEYGAVPPIWYAKSGLNRILQPNELEVALSCMGGSYSAKTPEGLRAYCENNPVVKLPEPVRSYDGRWTAFVTQSSIGVTHLVVTQYRHGKGVFVNGDGTVSDASLPSGTTISAGYFDTKLNPSWVKVGKRPWPF